MFDLISVVQKAKESSVELSKMTDDLINKALNVSADYLVENCEFILGENAVDILNAKEKNMSPSFIDRLTLSEKTISGMAEGIRQVATLNSPVGKLLYSYENKDQDILVEKKAVPFGVVGIIYESRPNVTADAFALCFKTKNAVVLKGGKEAIKSNVAICKVLKKALESVGAPKNCVQVIEDTSRETTVAFMKMNKYVDLLIPRGSGSLIKTAVENATIPIIETGTGNCHAFIDESADRDMCAKVIFNAKTQRYSVCNALESIVVHEKALNILPTVAEKLKEKQVEIRADEKSFDILSGYGYPYLKRASEDDFYQEYGDAIISVKTVNDIGEAIKHINIHSTGHSETILTCNKENAERFLNEIDSSTVYVNASTRFTDGFVFGLGAEIGISTQKLHARGPMGLDALVTSKYYVHGNGSVRK